MGEKRNCWEEMKCGREPGGPNSAEFGICPAINDTSSEGLNGGKNGGRICWAISGTFCGGAVQGAYTEKHITCMNCEFFKLVQNEEGAAEFMLLKPGQTFKPRSSNGSGSVEAGN